MKAIKDPSPSAMKAMFLAVLRERFPEVLFTVQHIKDRTFTISWDGPDHLDNAVRKQLQRYRA